MSKIVHLWAKATRREYILSSFFIFCRDSGIIYPIYEQPHKEMCDELERCEPIPGTGVQHKELYLAPRKTYKTSLVVAFIIYCILRNPNIRIGLGRATAQLARGLLFEVKQKLKYPVILEIFGDLSKDAPIWSADQIVVNTRTRAFHEPTVDTFGLGSSLTGQHLDLIFGDDFVNENNYLSDAAKQAGRTTIQSMFPVLETHGSIVLSGTRWAANDLYGWVMDNDDALEQAAADGWTEGKPDPTTARQWRTYIRGAYTVSGDLFFPASITEKFLEQQRASLETKLFASWYLNQPFEEGLKVFTSIPQREFDYFHSPFPIVVYEDKQQVANIPVFVTMTIDPALMSNPTNDQMGVTILGCDADDCWWVLHSEGFRKLPSEQAARVLYLIRYYQPKVVVQESAGADAEFTARLSLGIKELNDGLEDHKHIKLVGYSALRDEQRGKRGKAQRIESLEPRFREGKIYLRRGTTGDLYRQLNAWPDVPNNLDDVIDSLAMQRVVAKPATTKAMYEQYAHLEAEEERISWGGGTPVEAVLGRALSHTGRSTQRLRA
jgi:hypothetical protein